MRSPIWMVIVLASVGLERVVTGRAFVARQHPVARHVAAIRLPPAAPTGQQDVASMEFKDYYGILGVEPSAGDAEIKTAYRRLARKYHPDVSKEAGAEDKFKAVNEAYEALRDPARRKAYDQLRAGGYRPGDQVRPPPGGFHRGPGGQPDVDFDEIFAGGGAGGGFSDFFESLFGRGRIGQDKKSQEQRWRRDGQTRGATTPPLYGLNMVLGSLRHCLLARRGTK
jgi:curved DNA-binding protein CbpA